MSLRVKVVVITLLVIVFVVGALTSPWLIYYYRESQFNSARYLVESNGGGLSFGMVDGEYFLYLSNATDQTIDQLLPSLLNLPTGFTFIGPGEDREFWLTVNDASISDSRLAKLCELHLCHICLQNCQNLTDASAIQLSKLAHTYVSIGEGVPFSDDAIRRLQFSLKYRCDVYPTRAE